MNTRNHVILNGVSSRTIDGLLISELPSITKPLMRTTIDEIDGRGGDIVTNLGYSAYDRTMSIGLHNGYDMDEVISFFASSGTAIFSNEPDKIYQYQIIKQIDYQRLLRFRTATVTFHCQPFKSSAVEGDGLDKSSSILTIPNYSLTKNGLTVAVTDGQITITGTPTKSTEFFIPIEMDALEEGNYSLSVDGTVTGFMRICSGIPLNASSMGGRYFPITLGNYALTVSQASDYNTLWLYITSSSAVDATLNLSVLAKSIRVMNLGNVEAMPTITLNGSGTVSLSVNGGDSFVAVIPDSGHLTLDVESLEAYDGNTLYNRYVSGDYRNLHLKQGENIITWSGEITSVHVERYSLWI